MMPMMMISITSVNNVSISCDWQDEGGEYGVGEAWDRCIQPVITQAVRHHIREGEIVEGCTRAYWHRQGTKVSMDSQVSFSGLPGATICAYPGRSGAWPCRQPLRFLADSCTPVLHAQKDRQPIGISWIQRKEHVRSVLQEAEQDREAAYAREFAQHQIMPKHFYDRVLRERSDGPRGVWGRSLTRIVRLCARTTQRIAYLEAH